MICPYLQICGSCGWKCDTDVASFKRHVKLHVTGAALVRSYNEHNQGITYLLIMYIASSLRRFRTIHQDIYLHRIRYITPLTIRRYLIVQTTNHRHPKTPSPNNGGVTKCLHTICIICIIRFEKNFDQ